MQDSESENKNNIDEKRVLQVGEKSDVEISFSLSIFEGPVVEETEEGETFRFTIGDGTFLNKLDELLIGLEVGTTATFTIPPDEAFGQKSSGNYQTMSRQDFPADMMLEEGHVIGFDTPTGEEVPGKIEKVEGDEVLIDFNHPLAGLTIVFMAKIEAIHS